MPDRCRNRRAPERASAVARLSAESCAAGCAVIAVALIFLLCPAVLP